MDSHQFAHWFRASSPYIREHRYKTFVVVLSRAVLRSSQLANIVQDLALLNVLDIRLLVVLELDSISSDPVVTEAELISSLETARSVTHHLETLFMVGIPASRLRHRHIPVVSGNFLSARPRGVIQGVDHDFAGAVRRVHHEDVTGLLERGNVVLISPFGHSTTGRTYHITSHELVLALATALEPDKVIVFEQPEFVKADCAYDNSDLTTTQLTSLLQEDRFSTNARRCMETLISCCRTGVPRCHIVSFTHDGALLQELYTADGSGVQISDGPYRLIRRATAEDVTSIIELLRPFEEDGTLLSRNRNLLVASIRNFFVAEIDDTIVGTVCLYDMHDGVQEIGSLVTVPGQRNQRLGQDLLSRAESEAMKLGARTALVKTTQAIDWFIDNGYIDTAVTELPRFSQRSHDSLRNSKVLIKSLT